SDAEGMFDVLTYEKGAAVVRMLEQYLGEDRFRAGIRRYMAEHPYGNTETTDLWDAIEAATGEPVRRIMDSWIFQGGHPIVTVEASDDGRSLRIGQQRFSYLPDADTSTRWSVPLQLRVGHPDGTTSTVVRLLEGDAIEVALDQPATWVVANAEGHGFFRVRYVGALQEALAERVLEVCSKVERYQLVDDTWASVLAGSTPAEAFLALAERMADETDVSVWRRLLGGLDQLDRLVDGDARDALRARIRAVVAPALERMGWEPGGGESDRERALPGALIGALAVLAADAAAQARVRALFTRVRQGEAVEANVAAAVVRATAALATDRELDALIAG